MMRWAPRKRVAMRGEHGQMLALLAVSIVALTAAGAFVMDIGAWFQSHRATQSVADASALAGAQALPTDAAVGLALALEYAGKNGGGVSAADVRFESQTLPNDTIAVKARRTAPGFLSRVLGISSVDVSADAVARAYNIAEARYAAPFAVDKSHPLISGSGCPCFDEPTTLELGKIGPGAFQVVNIDGSRGGVGQQTLADWILRGYDGYMPLGWYYSDPGAKFNPGAVQDALSSRIGEELLFPVFDSVQDEGSSFTYRIVGWVGFRLDGFQARGVNAELYGVFRSIVWDGIATESADGYLGARVVKLVG
jgi:Putative Flp pilus-assembly TadE/G-like